jgi:bifunctional non-homologous end joining protein LigD
VRERFSAGGREVRIEDDTVAVDDVSFRLTHPGKVLWPGEGYTKLDLAAYYLAASPHILPYLSGRPLILELFQQGVGGPPLFIQKRPQGTPAWVEEACVSARAGHRVCHLMVDDSATGAATLAWLANRNCIPLHAWLATETQQETPDWVAFDLDPAEGATFSQVVRIAQWLHGRLEELRLRSFVKTSGSRGLHVMAPILPENRHDEVRSFATAVAEEAVKALPGDATLLWPIPERKGKVFVDIRRNTYGHTLVAPYSVRAKPGAPVSVAVEWDELDDPGLSPTRWDMGATLARLEKRGDPFAAAREVRQALPPAPRA